MMYRRPHINHKLLSSLIICGSIAVFVSHEVYAGNETKNAPLKVYIPNAVAFLNYFTMDKLEYNPDEFILVARGNVEAEQQGTIVKADAVEYDQLKETVNARGEVAILAPDGKVTFADAVEFKDGIKDGVIHHFKAQMMDNELFMAVEEEKSRKPASRAVAKNSQSFLGKIFAYFSPDAGSVNNPARLAALAPAAGGDGIIGDKPVIGSVPLIVLPDEKTNAKDAGKKEEVKKLEVVESKDLPPAIPSEKDAPPVAPAVASIDAAVSPVETTSKLPEIKEEIKQEVKLEKPVEEKKLEKKPADKVVKNQPVKDKTKVSEKKHEKKSEPSKVVLTKIETQIVPEPATVLSEPTTLASGDLSEPVQSLSPQSRDLLDKVKPSIPSPQKIKPLKPLKMNHSRDMQDLFKADEFPVAGSQHESLGVKVENKNPKLNIDYELEKAYNALNSGQSEAAMGTYQNILENAPNNTQAIFGLATLYHRARQFDKARPLYGRLLTIDPQHRDGFNNFLVLLADEAPLEALSELEKLEDQNPGFSTIPAQIAVIYQKMGNSDKAIGKMFRAVSLAPENLTYRYNLAIMLDKQKNYDEAAKLYRQLIEASERGEKIPGNISNIQQRLTFISSNRP